MNKELKQEASIPVQARVNINSLANLDIYWGDEGYHIKSMSQLVSWSVELLYEILLANGKIRYKISSVAEAKNHLEKKKLFQPSLRNRAFKKIGTAISFENLRKEGVDPAHHVPQQHSMIHNKRSVEPFEGSVDTEKVAKLTEEALKIFNSLGNEDRLKNKQSENE